MEEELLVDWIVCEESFEAWPETSGEGRRAKFVIKLAG